MGDALKLLVKTVKSLRRRLSLSAYLGSSMFYRDALNGLYGFGGTYAHLVLNWELVSIGIFGIIAAISAAVFSWIGGKADKRFGPRPVIISVWVLIVVCVTIVSMDRNQIFGIPLAEGSQLPDAIFFVCGALIGGMGGVLQAASRSLMVRHTDPAGPDRKLWSLWPFRPRDRLHGPRPDRRGHGPERQRAHWGCPADCAFPDRPLPATLG